MNAGTGSASGQPAGGGGTFVDRYLAVVHGQLDTVAGGQREAVETAAGWVATALGAGRSWFVSGTGHSHLLALEGFYRAGGLVRVIPVLETSLMLHVSASASTDREREPGLGAALVDRYGMGPGDVLTVVSNSGRNTVPVETALAARERGVRVMALTSLAHSRSWPSRHPSGQRLFEVADLVLDNGAVPGDAAVVPAGREVAMGPTSTLTGAFLLHAVAGRSAELAAAAGRPLETYHSSNGPGEEANRRFLDRYRGVIPHL